MCVYCMVCMPRLVPILGGTCFLVPLLGIQDGLVEFVGFMQKQMVVHYILQVARART